MYNTYFICLWTPSSDVFYMRKIEKTNRSSDTKTKVRVYVMYKDTYENVKSYTHGRLSDKVIRLGVIIRI